MNPSDQEILLLGHLAALRRRGVAPHVALALSAAPLPPGALRDTATTALRSLAAGRSTVAGGPPAPGADLLALLSDGTASPERLDLARQAAEARSRALASTSLARFTLSVGLAAPLLVATTLAWVLPLPGLTSSWPLADVVATVAAPLRWVGPTLVLALPLLLRRLRFAPGRRKLETAARLLASADDPNVAGPSPALRATLTPDEQAFLDIRRVQVGPAAAARDLASVLSEDGWRATETFVRLAPRAGLLLAAGLTGMAVLALAGPLLSLVDTLEVTP